MLYTPIKFRNLELKNRWVMSASSSQTPAAKVLLERRSSTPARWLETIAPSDIPCKPYERAKF